MNRNNSKIQNLIIQVVDFHNPSTANHSSFRLITAFYERKMSHPIEQLAIRIHGVCIPEIKQNRVEHPMHELCRQHTFRLFF